MTQAASLEDPRPVRVPDTPDGLKMLIHTGLKWRPGQKELIQKIIDSKKKIVMLEAECGTGKSYIPTAAAVAAGKQAVVLIQTIQLQQQYLRDFKAVMMMGRRHFICNQTKKSAQFAPCTIGAKCHEVGIWDRDTGKPIVMPTCTYYGRKAEAKLAPLSIHNYAYFLREINSEKSTFDRVPWVICDEGHELDAILMDVATLELPTASLRMAGLPTTPDFDVNDLKNWIKLGNESIAQFASRAVEILAELRRHGVVIKGEEDEPYETAWAGEEDDDGPAAGPLDVDQASNVEQLIQTYQTIRAVREVFEALIQVNPDEYVYHKDKEGSTHLFKPIYGKYGFKKLLDVAQEKIIIMSAFLAPKMLIRTLGLNEEDVDIIEAPPAFDRTDSPIVFLPIDKFGYATTDAVWRIAAKAVDIIANKQKTKGLVHVPSVALRNKILKLSSISSKMLAYDAEGRNAQYPPKEAVIKTFVDSPDQLILVGQSISTGLDLPYIPQWQAIVKLAFMPTDDPAIVKRMQVDPDFYAYKTICELVQAAGRVKRAPDHGGPTYILDQSFQWFYSRNRSYFPKWFIDNLVYQGWKTHNDIRLALMPFARMARLKGW